MIAAERIATAVTESDGVEVSSIFSQTLTQMLAEPVAATLRSLEQTRDALVKAMDVVVSTSVRDAPEELPKPTGMPMVDVNEISQIIVIEKPRILSLLGKSMLASHVRRKLATDYDRALLEFLSLYAIVSAVGWSRASMLYATRLTHLPTSIARTLKRRPLWPVQLTRQRFKTIFGFCASGKGRKRSGPAATNFCAYAGQAHRHAYSMLLGIPQYSR